jgi:hypothetical protein
VRQCDSDNSTACAVVVRVLGNDSVDVIEFVRGAPLCLTPLFFPSVSSPPPIRAPPFGPSLCPSIRGVIFTFEETDLYIFLCKFNMSLQEQEFLHSQPSIYES